MEINRRTFLALGGTGLGRIALGHLGGPGLSPIRPDFAPRAKRVIFLCMAGGPSQFESFDNKPKLGELDGQAMPSSYTAGQPIAQLQGQKLKILGARFPFARHGESGQEVASVLPRIAEIADDICIVRSMQTDQINHDPAHTVMNTGTSISGRPSMGSWINYGIGSEAQNLPGFCVLTSIGGRNPQPIASRQWGSGFLPGRLQGVELHGSGDPVHYISNPPGADRRRQREVIDAVTRLDRLRDHHEESDRIRTRIAQYELAFRMQMSVPELADFSDEPKHVLDLYGAKGADGSFASNCLMARRLAERGVRFIQLYHRGWDHHGDVKRWMNVCAGHCDGPSAALVKDLKQRGMLDDTLVIWSGEFGRTPMFQGKGKTPGRDHHIRSFSLWMAGGGIRGGLTYGQTDELGYNAVENIVHVRDLHATMLHLLGMDHSKLKVRHQGLDMRLTGVEPARVVRDILA